MSGEQERIAILRAVLNCTESSASMMFPLVTWSKVDRDETILHQGDEQRHCHFVISGTANIKALGREGQYVQLATVETGEIIGSYPEGSTAKADVRAQTRLELASIEISRLAEITFDQAEIGAGVARIFARQLGNVMDRLALRVTLTASGRVYSQLLRLADDHFAIAPVPIVSALAVEAQTTRETASRAISALERRGILERDEDRWTIVAPRMLEEMIF